MYEVSEIKPSGATFDQLGRGGVSGILERLIEANSEGLTALDYQMLRSVKNGNLQDVYARLRQLVADFNRGAPVPLGQMLYNLERVHRVFATLARLSQEIGKLVEDNPGEISGAEGEPSRRTWP